MFSFCRDVSNIVSNATAQANASSSSAAGIAVREAAYKDNIYAVLAERELKQELVSGTRQTSGWILLRRMFCRLPNLVKMMCSDSTCLIALWSLQVRTSAPTSSIRNEWNGSVADVSWWLASLRNLLLSQYEPSRPVCLASF